MKSKKTCLNWKLATLLIACVQANAAMADCDECGTSGPLSQSGFEMLTQGNSREALPSPMPSSHGFSPGYDTGKRALGITPNFRWLVDEDPIEVCQMIPGTGRELPNRLSPCDVIAFI